MIEVHLLIFVGICVFCAAGWVLASIQRWVINADRVDFERLRDSPHPTREDYAASLKANEILKNLLWRVISYLEYYVSVGNHEITADPSGRTDQEAKSILTEIRAVLNQLDFFGGKPLTLQDWVTSRFSRDEYDGSSPPAVKGWKRSHQNRELAYKVVVYLNELAALDKSAIRSLIDFRVPCNKALADHYTCQVQSKDGQYSIEMLGILNGLCGIDSMGNGGVEASFGFDETTQKSDLLGFTIGSSWGIFEQL